MKFNELSKVIVIGEGSVAQGCFKIAKEFFANTEYIKSTELIDSKKANKKELDEYFASLSGVLIISANCLYLFKSAGIDGNVVINYHNSPLPILRGLNAHVWAIYAGLTSSAISWHFVNERIDDGRIIYKEQIQISNDMSSGELLILQQRMAVNSMSEVLATLQAADDLSTFGKANDLENVDLCAINASNINIDEFRWLCGEHKGTEIPENGVLNLSSDIDKISRFLRAMNAGAFSALPKPKIELFGELRKIKYYEIKDDGLLLKLSQDLQINIKKA